MRENVGFKTISGPKKMFVLKRFWVYIVYKHLKSEKILGVNKTSTTKVV